MSVEKVKRIVCSGGVGRWVIVCGMVRYPLGHLHISWLLTVHPQHAAS